MDTRSLRHIVALANRLNFARAAQDVGLSQSAFSRSIQAIERQAGMRLFDRDRSGVRITAQCRAILVQAQILLAEIDAFDKELRSTARGEHGRIRFGIAPTPAAVLLSSVLPRRIAATPDLRNEVVVLDVETMWPMLICGDIEFMVAPEGMAPDAIPVRNELLGSFPLDLIVRSDHPLLRGECLGEQYPLLMSSIASGSIAPSNGQIHPSIGPVHIINDYTVLAHIVRTTNAIWLATTFAVLNEIRDGTLCTLTHEDVEMPHRRKIVMYSLRGRSRSPAAAQLRDMFMLRLRELESLVS